MQGLIQRRSATNKVEKRLLLRLVSALVPAKLWQTVEVSIMDSLLVRGKENGRERNKTGKFLGKSEREISNIVIYFNYRHYIVHLN